MGGVEPSGTSCGLVRVAGVRSCGRVACLFSFPLCRPTLPYLSSFSFFRFLPIFSFFFPPDQDTAEFLCSVVPDLWLAKYNVSVAKVTVALQQANLKTPRPAFEERVAQALTTLGPPPPPPPR